jgi:hypothetical protein
LLYTAYLATNKRVEGKPHQTVTYLASIQNGQIGNPQHQQHFWQKVEESIKDLDLDSPTRTMIRTRLLERVPIAQAVPVQADDPTVPDLGQFDHEPVVPTIDPEPVQATVHNSEQFDHEMVAPAITPEPVQDKRQRAKQDEPLTVWDIADFSQTEAHGYWCSATQGDMVATLALLPKFGGYVINQSGYKKVTNGGKTGRNQDRRGKSLLDELREKTVTAMANAGWFVVETTTHYTLYKKVG